MMHALAPWLSALVAASLKGSVILIAVLLALRGMRRSSAEARHAILAIGLVAFLLVPLGTLLAPAWAVVSLPGLPVDVTAAIDRATGDDRVIGGSAAGPASDVRAADAHGVGMPRPSAERSAEPANAGDGSANGSEASGNATSRSSAPAATSSEPPSVSTLTPRSRGEALMLVWLVGASLIGLRLLLGLARLRFLSRRATMVTDGAWLQTAHGIARRLGLTRGVTLLRGDREAVPMTWGVLSPVVWLPPAADAWPSELRSSVLSHELAHVRRRDAVMQWIANIAVAVHWFNPLVWIATRALRAERERACDDAVLALGAAPDDYAAHLLDMVRALGARGGPAPAMAMARRSQFEGRLLAILDRACSRAPVGAGRLVAAGAGAAALVLVLGGLRITEAARAPEAALDTTQLRLPIGVVAAPPERARATNSRSLTPRSGSRPSDAPVAPTRLATGQVNPATSLRLATAAVMPMTPPLAAVSPAPAPSPPSDVGRSPTLQAATLSRNDTALLLDVIAAAEGISTSSDRVAVLERVASVPDLAPTVVTALGKAAGRVASSTSRAKLLRTIVRRQPHAIGESRRAVLDALSNEVNSTDFSAVLEDFIKRDSITEPALADAFTAAAKINSSTEKTRVLLVAARLRKPEGAARAAYLKTASTITSGSDRARVLSALFEEPPGERTGAPAKQH